MSNPCARKPALRSHCPAEKDGTGKFGLNPSWHNYCEQKDKPRPPCERTIVNKSTQPEGNV